MGVLSCTTKEELKIGRNKYIKEETTSTQTIMVKYQVDNKTK